MTGDPRHDALISNPELREAFNKALEHGMTEDEAHEYARREVFGDEYYEDQYGSSDSDGVQTKSRSKEALVLGEEGMSKAEDYTAFDDALLDAIKKSSWWVDQEYNEGTDLSKAPGIWRKDDQVPQYVRDTLEEVIDNTRWDWDTFESLDPQEAKRLEEMLEEKLTQPQGWSIRSLANDIEEEFFLPEDAAVGIAADSSHNVLNTAREEGYEEMEGSEQFEYSWIGPDDHRTTEVCKEIKEAVEDKGGSVTQPTLKSILMRKAQKYEGTREGGTPDRVDKWEPHYQCRHTFVREVKSI